MNMVVHSERYVKLDPIEEAEYLYIEWFTAVDVVFGAEVADYWGDLYESVLMVIQALWEFSYQEAMEESGSRKTTN